MGFACCPVLNLLLLIPPTLTTMYHLAFRYRSGNLIPLRSRFSQLPKKLPQLGVNDFFDAVVIETGISTLQWNDTDRGFCPRRKGFCDVTEKFASRPCFC